MWWYRLSRPLRYGFSFYLFGAVSLGLFLVSRFEVIETGSRRRWSLEEKRRVVAESESAPRQASATALRHGIRPTQLFMWRRLAQEGRLGADGDGQFAQAVIGVVLSAHA
jgi:hypothetical protein